MLDINYVREHLDEVRERLASRGFDTSALDRFSELDVRRRRAITEHGELSAERNRLSPEIGKLMKEGNKAEAVAWLRSETGAATVVFAGDDQTDEDVFRAAEATDVTVHVGPGETAARFRVADITDVIELLDRLAELSPSAA